MHASPFGPITIAPIAWVKSCFIEKFGIPRQPGLAPAATAEILFLGPFGQPQAFAGLEKVSHIWVQFGFHAWPAQPFAPKVRPPRLGGNVRVGVFATRSPNRPNGLGLSVVQLLAITEVDGLVRLQIAGHDLLDGTPVYDIKPYVPYADRPEQAVNTLAPAAPELRPVIWLHPAPAEAPQTLIEQLLQQDPRPAYQRDTTRRYHLRVQTLPLLRCWNVTFFFQETPVEAVCVEQVTMV